jgi:Concanavalin A-like lectin/glucanases superfamily
MGPDLADLLSAWQGREIEPSRREELLERLRQDAPFRLEFIAEIRMLGMLKTVQSPESRWLRLEDELGWGASEANPVDTLEDRIVRRLELAPRFGAWRWRKWGAGAAALLLAVGAFAAYRHKPAREPGGTARRHYPRVDAASGLAMVVKLDRVIWESSSDPRPVEGNVLAAGRLKFASGRTVVSMLTGVVLDIEGPADVELIDADRVLCRRGKIRARVPAGAEGFRVLGPNWAVVDLGTEFTLDVGEDGKTRGQVLDGKLEAASLSPTGTPERTFLLNSAQADASKAFEIDSRSGRIEAVAAPAPFVRPVEPIAPPLSLTPNYAASVRRSRPWGYWRFESMDGRDVPNEVPGRPTLLATGPIHLATAPDGNHWAEFEAVKGRQFLSMREPWHPSWDPGFAVEFWCLSKSIGHASLVSLLTPKNTDHHVFLLELTAKTRLTIHQPASVRLLHRWPAGWEAGDNTYSQEPYVPYRWHHIVGQVTKDHIELFMDGRLSSTLSITPSHRDVSCRFVLGRLTELVGSGISVDRPFVGRMDEVALYDHPLAADEIRDHHRLGALDADPN